MLNDPIWTIKDVASFLKLSPLTVYRLTRKGVLPAVKFGSQWRYARSSIEEIMKNPDILNQNNNQRRRT